MFAFKEKLSNKLIDRICPIGDKALDLCENHEGSTFPQRHHLNLFDGDDDTVLCLIVAITGAACVAA